MNRNLRITAAGLFCLLAFTQCGTDCAKEVCIESLAPTFSLRLNNSGGQNIVMGPFKVYDTADVTITARKASNGAIESIPRQFNITRNAAGTADSLCTTGFTVNKDYATYYLRLNNTVTDSLQFVYNRNQSECCDLSNYSLVKVNTSSVTGITLPVLTGYVLVK
ncbi:MAG: hypothetical protein ACKVOW_02245 [Chitinophagaceae bacterium]